MAMPIIMLEEEDPIYGDMLEEILSRVPLIDLIPTLHVSKSWNQAVHSSLLSRNPPKPWLIIHSQATRHPYATTTRAYDPCSRVWIKMSQPASIKHATALRSSNSNFLYMLSPSKLSFSFDKLNLRWHHVDAPLLWRGDPIVAEVGDSIVVAGGTCDFEDDPLAVEIYSIKNRSWRTCDSMPARLKDSAASTWLSVAATPEKLFVMEKHSGATYWFDLDSNDWSKQFDIRPDQRCFYSVIGCVKERLILVGLIGDVENVEKVKVWEVGCDSDSGSFDRCMETGEMPRLFVEKLESETFGISSINICLAGSFVYIYNPEKVEEVVACELIKGGGCNWGSVHNAVSGGVCGMERVVFTCADVKVEELERALGAENRRFEVVNV
ncbi:F-box/kelch-repeat protein At1g23390-like [Coffea arabica]|uniref:F-box/kelch-repeat protein At1g23390-like n=1 Tax=Coffea arabica TaxID=13443 RepID=A0ABM4W7D2_COFAR